MSSVHFLRQTIVISRIFQTSELILNVTIFVTIFWTSHSTAFFRFTMRKKREELFPKKLVANGKEMVAKYSVSAYSRYTISFLATYVMQAIPNILDAGWERNLHHAELAWFIHQSNVCYFTQKRHCWRLKINWRKWQTLIWQAGV